MRTSIEEVKMLIPLFVVLAVAACRADSIGPDNKSFRNDYEYSEDAIGWLKLHRMPSNWNDARLHCQLEGAKLASPLRAGIVAEGLLRGMNTIIRRNKLAAVFTGISAVHSKGDFYSIEGIPLHKISVGWAPSEPNNIYGNEQCITLDNKGLLSDVNCEASYPFLCYRPYKDVALTDCGTVDPNYRYVSVTGNCYKFHTLGQNWTRAFMTCSAEGGYLAVVNSNNEAQALKNLFGQYPHQSIMAEFKDVARIGVKAEPDTFDWMTIHGQTLAEAGFEVWQKGEPSSGFTQSCAALSRSGELDDIRCEPHLPFICEKTPDSLRDKRS